MPSSNHDSEIVTLLTQNQSGLRLYVQSLMPGDPQADDVAQETNTLIWEKRNDFELGSNFKAWAFSIARMRVRKCRYRQAKDARLIFCGELEDKIAAEFPAYIDALSEHQLALQECLKTLKPAHRELVHHRYFEKSSLESYSKEVGRSVGVLKVTLHRIRNRLQDCITKRLAQGKVAQA